MHLEKYDRLASGEWCGEIVWLNVCLFAEKKKEAVSCTRATYVFLGSLTLPSLSVSCCVLKESKEAEETWHILDFETMNKLK